jgi:3-mercaptopyruvate sulfurtransferase SseA
MAAYFLLLKPGSQRNMMEGWFEWSNDPDNPIEIGEPEESMEGMPIK